jgi:hypothetical protein
MNNEIKIKSSISLFIFCNEGILHVGIWEAVYTYTTGRKFSALWKIADFRSF